MVYLGCGVVSRLQKGEEHGRRMIRAGFPSFFGFGWRTVISRLSGFCCTVFMLSLVVWLCWSLRFLV